AAAFGPGRHAIVVRCALDRAATLRGRHGREAALEAAGEPVAPDTAGPSAERTAARLRLERAMASLSAAQRAVVTLFYYHDRSVGEVAAVLGLPAGTVKTHLSRARAALRDGWLAGEDG